MTLKYPDMSDNCTPMWNPDSLKPLKSNHYIIIKSRIYICIKLFPQTITRTTFKSICFQKDSYFELLPPTENTKHLKVLYVGLTPSGWTKYCSQRVFLIGPSSSDLTQVARLRVTNRNKRTWLWMIWNTLCFPPTGNPAWVNWQWGGFTNHNIFRHSGQEQENNWLYDCFSDKQVC